MTRDEALRVLRTVIDETRAEVNQASARAAFVRLTRELEGAARRRELEDARDDMSRALPGIKAVVDLIIAKAVASAAARGEMN
ncbi:MAG TPA: hypothetical protein VKD72_13375 [Gemmataceae bacterium]|nr:hypothetical protein [Gemmataceae bacterium]